MQFGHTEESSEECGTEGVSGCTSRSPARNSWYVSGTVKDLVAGSGITFEDRGVQVLNGLPGEWHLYAVASG